MSLKLGDILSTLSDGSTGPSLTSLYLETQKMRNSLQNGSDPSLHDLAARREFEATLITKLQTLDSLIDSSDLFSPNEIIDDVQTASLKYLLVAFYLGESLFSRSVEMLQREPNVRAAQIALMKYLDRCEQLMLLDEIAKKDLNALFPNRVQDEDEREKAPQLQDIMAQRQEKILKYNREKALKYKLESMNYELEKRRKQYEKRQNAPIGSVGVVTQSSDPNEILEETELSENEREVMLLTIELYIMKAVDSLRFIKQELELLEYSKTEQSVLPRSTVGTAAGLLPPEERNKLQDIQQQTSSEQYHQHLTSQPNVSGGGEVKQYGSMIPTNEPSKPIKVYNIKEHKDAAAPIPSHMKDYLHHVNPKGDTTSRSDNTSHTHTGSCSHTHHHESDEERLGRNWFRPNAYACEHCKDDDVTKRVEYTKYMLDKKRGGRGMLVPACPIHGNSHPAGQCPGISANTGGAAKGAFGYADPINARVELVTDRAAVFRDRNPYLMELDDWADMKQKEGTLPSARDVRLAQNLRDDEERRQQRIEDGDEEDEEQAKTQRQIYDDEDEAQMKLRDWDEFTDHVKKGSGNLKK